MTTKTQKSHKMTTKRCKHGHHEAQSDHTSTMTTTKRCLMITKNNKWTTKRHKTHYKEKRKTFKETENHYKNVENDHTGMQKRSAKLKDSLSVLLICPTGELQGVLHLCVRAYCVIRTPFSFHVEGMQPLQPELVQEHLRGMQ